MTQLIISLGLIGLAIAVLLTVITGKFSTRGSGIASLTAFHDLQPKDKQGAVEIIVEQKADAKWVEQENGLGVNKNNLSP